MKIALLGDGKSGSFIKELREVTPFNELHPPTLSALQDFDVAISFLPGTAFVQYIDMLIEARLHLICASTGFTFDPSINDRLIDNNLIWCYSSNFSLGMGVIYHLFKYLRKDLLPQAKFSITETHHTAKKDAPSGTALSWREWLGRDIEIKSIREGDVVGIHQLLIDSPLENITITHQAKDRKMFAQGAIWALDHLFNYSPGLISFYTMIENELYRN